MGRDILSQLMYSTRNEFVLGLCGSGDYGGYCYVGGRYGCIFW